MSLLETSCAVICHNDESSHVVKSKGQLYKSLLINIILTSANLAFVYALKFYKFTLKFPAHENNLDL